MVKKSHVLLFYVYQCDQKCRSKNKTEFKCLGIEVRETVLLSGTIKWIEKIFDIM